MIYSLEVNFLILEVIKKENEFKKKSELDTLIFNSMEERFKMDKSKKDDLKL